MKCRNTTLYRVVHRVNRERRPKNFSSLADAKADAKNIIKEIYTQGDSKIHLAADEKLDWQAAMNVLKRAGSNANRILLETFHACPWRVTSIAFFFDMGDCMLFTKSNLYCAGTASYFLR